MTKAILAPPERHEDGQRSVVLCGEKLRQKRTIPGRNLGFRDRKSQGILSRWEKSNRVTLKQQERKGDGWSHSIEDLTSRARGEHQLLLDK